ncbi:MAG: polysaccharide biosynthesis/export family protein [Saprospiraceae bacterium]|nr:polysaccharide biosynthesis/export family protein [Saprospiraceae bacterium]MDW8228597.1 polysaccharide biosynthesis/export family protein [Saprospiraceae bacterium]
MRRLLHPALIFALLALLVLQTSCIQHHQLVNFDTGPQFDSLPSSFQHPALRIQYDDLLAITVLSQVADPKATAPFQAAASPGAAAAGGPAEPTYLVDVHGCVNIPMAGRVRVVGLTTQEARDTIARHIEPYLKNPIVNVKLANFRFSVLGEVNKAGTYTVGYEHVTILEALSMAGDVAKYGNRENILVIRRVDGQRQYGRINLHRRDVFQSPFFYIRQGDIIYVEPLKAKVGDTADATTKYLQWALPVVSVLGLLVTLFTATKG